jgi:hypothetical protein
MIADAYTLNRFNSNRKVNFDFIKTEMLDYDDDVDKIQPDERA